MTDTVIYQKPKTRDLDIQNFEQIVADNESKIFNTIYSFVGNRDDALDLTQETFICAYRSLGKFRYESSISTWLYRIAINLCKKSHSRKKRYDLVFTGSLDDPDLGLQVDNRDSGEKSAVEVLEINEEESAIRHEIYALPRKYRTVIILKYLQDLSYQEIADIIGCNIGTVKSRLSRAKDKLKDRLEKAAGVYYDKV